MEVSVALWIIESSPFLRAFERLTLSSASSISVWLMAVSAFTLEIIWASLPANWTSSDETSVALIIAKMLLSVLIS